MCLKIYKKLSKHPIALVVALLESQKIAVLHTFNRNFLSTAGLEIIALKNGVLNFVSKINLKIVERPRSTFKIVLDR